MKSKLIPPTFDVLSFLPKNFFNKDVNEKFIKLVMESVLGDGNWQKGKHDLKSLIIFLIIFHSNLHLHQINVRKIIKIILLIN